MIEFDWMKRQFMFQKGQLTEIDRSFSKRAGKIISLVLSFSILSCLFLTSCKKVRSEFPTIPTSDTSETTEQKGSESIPDSKTMELTVASPLSYETVSYLAKLYVAKSSGLLGDGVTGETVDLSYLSSIDLPFVLSVYDTSETGCNADTLKQWRASGDMPDIFLTDSFDQVVSEGLALPITKYLSEISLLSSDRIYMGLLSSFFTSGEQYGIPYQTSAAVLYCDMEVMNMADIATVSFKQSRTSLLDLLSKLNELNASERTVLPFYLAGNLLPYLPSAMFNHSYLSASTEEDRADQAYRDSLSYLDSIIGTGFSYESMTDEETEAFFSGLSPLLSRKVGIWAGTTSEISIYDNYMPNTLCLMQIPGITEDEYTSPLLISYPLCISSSCESPKEASELACFMALDEDALLLAARLSPKEGYMPSISSPTVWKNVVLTQKYGYYLEQFHERMDQAILIPAVSESVLFQQDIRYISQYLEETYKAKDLQE